MSSPTSSFRRLSLGKMPSPRAQELSAAQGGSFSPSPGSGTSSGSSDGDSGSEQDEDIFPRDLPGYIRSRHTGLRYDVRGISPKTTSRARAGLEEAFTLDQCRVVHAKESEDNEEYLAFQISETLTSSVRMGGPDSRYKNIECRCGDQPSCRHIFWLLDQITKQTLSVQPENRVLKLTSSGYAVEASDAYERISSIGIDTFVNQLQSLATQTRQLQVREIMSAFSRTASDTYRPDLFTASTQPLLEHALASRDFEAAFIITLLNNNELFHQILSLRSPSTTATNFFAKKSEQARTVFSLLDAYAAGHTATTQHTVLWCAEQLTKLVASISNHLNSVHTPLSPMAKSAAASALVNILTWVVEHDINITAGSAKRPTSPDPEHNLYQRLVGQVASGQPRFVIDELQGMTDALGGLGAQLGDLAVRIRRLGVRDQGVVDKLREWSKRVGEGLEGGEYTRRRRMK